jgi:hypothetical protein
VQGTLTDWQGKLRIGDIVGDSLRILLRRPVLAVLAPTGVVALAGWVTQALDLAWQLEPLAESWGEFGVWMWAAQCAITLPLIALVWTLLARSVVESAPPGTGRFARIATATVLATLLCLTLVIANVATYVGGPVLFAFVGTAVPICACERLGPVASLRRAWMLVSNNRLRLLGAWSLLQLLVVVAMIAIGLAFFSFMRAADGAIPLEAMWAIALLVQASFFGMAVGVTMALAIAVYVRLRRARVEIDVDAWVEVFR